MDRLILAAIIAAVAVAVAFVLERRRTPAAVSVRRGSVPTRLRVDAFATGAGPAIVVFTERSCATCAGVLSMVAEGSQGLPIYEIEYRAAGDVHQEHAIDTVPTTVVVRGDGTVVAGWTGRFDSDSLAAAVSTAKAG